MEINFQTFRKLNFSVGLPNLMRSLKECSSSVPFCATAELLHSSSISNPWHKTYPNLQEFHNICQQSWWKSSFMCCCPKIKCLKCQHKGLKKHLMILMVNQNMAAILNCSGSSVLVLTLTVKFFANYRQRGIFKF